MNGPLDQLYNLLPAVYRQRDHEQGGPLHQLLAVVAEQVEIVKADMDQLYANWFIETCQDWVVPYIADLIGYRPVHDAGNPGDVASQEAQTRNKILIPRREVANTPAYRRRKGTLALLEKLAMSVAGWPAHAVEFFRRLGITQDCGLLGITPGHDQPALQAGRTVDLRKGSLLDRLDGPFDKLAHRPDARSIASRRSRGKYNLPNVGVYVWRLRAYRVTKTFAHCLAEEGLPHYYTFSVLGNDTPLFTGPDQRSSPDQPEELGLPAPIRRRAFEERVPGKTLSQASADYYGAEKSVAIWAGKWAKHDANKPIPRQAIVPADLSNWTYYPPRNSIALDPVLGRIAFPPDQLPRDTDHVYVSYYYGFAADLGGGEYDRPVKQHPWATIKRVRGHDQFHEALQSWQNDQPQHHVIEITDNGVYIEQINLQMTKEGQTLQLRAANGTRPVIRLLEWQTDRPNSLSVKGGQGCQFILDGLLVTGRGVMVEGGLEEVAVRHTTLVPGWGLHPHCEPRRPAEPSLELSTPLTRVFIDHSILGTIRVTHDDKPRDPIAITVGDSILDSAGPTLAALEAPGCLVANVCLTVLRSTVFGPAHVHAINLAENSIFTGVVRVADHQKGCMRFCYVPPGSRTPRRYNCQPDLVDRPPPNEAERLRVQPQFESVRYGTPGYARLAATCAPEICRGADDESEMGVYHDLFQPQRAANLQARLEEFVPASMDVGILYAT